MTGPPRDTWGPLAAVAVAVVAGVNAVLGFDLDLHRLGETLLGTGKVLLGAAAAVAVAAFVLGRGRPRAAGGRSVAVRGHAHTAAEPGALHLHEGGHMVGATGMGGRVRSARVYPDGSGLVRATVPDAYAALVFLRAGQAAAGTTDGSRADDAGFERTLREFPRGDRARVRRDAGRDTARLVARHRSDVHRHATTLARRGHA